MALVTAQFWKLLSIVRQMLRPQTSLALLVEINSDQDLNQSAFKLLHCSFYLSKELKYLLLLSSHICESNSVRFNSGVQ